MALRTLHLCQFQFKDVDIVRVGNATDGGTSLSGISDPIESDGGGYWRGQWSNGSTRDAATGLDWRLVADVLAGGTVAVNVLFCAERLFAPTLAAKHLPLQPSPFSDGSEFTTTASFTASAAALRATTFVITTGPYAQPIRPGMKFSVQHSVWGWRTYSLQSLAPDGTATFMPPLRQAISAGTLLEFDWVRCQMHVPTGFQVSTATNIGRYGQAALTLVEDMRKPPNA